MVLSYVVKNESVKYEVRIYLRAKVGHTRAILRHLSVSWGRVRVGVVSGCVMENERVMLENVRVMLGHVRVMLGHVRAKLASWGMSGPSQLL